MPGRSQSQEPGARSQEARSRSGARSGRIQEPGHARSQEPGAMDQEGPGQEGRSQPSQEPGAGAGAQEPGADHEPGVAAERVGVPTELNDAWSEKRKSFQILAMKPPQFSNSLILTSDS